MQFLEAPAIGDELVGEPVEQLGMARRLAEASLLRDDVTIQQATDLLWMLCSFETFDALYTDRGKSLDEAVELIILAAERSLCRPGA